MKKVIGAIIGIVAFTILFTASASASVIDDVKVVDAQQGIFSVKGTLEGNENNRAVSIFVLYKDKTLADLQTNIKGSLLHLGVQVVNYNGTYEYIFQLNASSDDYNFVAVYKDQVETRRIFYANWTEVEQFFVDISQNTMTDQALFDSLQKYSVSLGLDIATFQTDAQKAVAVKRIRQNRAEIGIYKQQVLSTVLEKAKRELMLMTDLKNVSIWNQVYPILSTTTDLTGITFTRYNLVTQKQNVDSKIMKQTFADADAVKAAFDKAVNDELARQGTGGGGGGGGGGPRVYVPNPDEVFPVEKTPEPKPVFADLKDVPWAKDAIEGLYLRNVVSGVDNSNFNPNGSILREEFAKIAVLAFGLHNKNAKSDFKDVKAEDWSYPFVSSAKEAGIILGDGDLFKKGEQISRQDLAVILYRIAVKKGYQFDKKIESFTDFAQIDDYAREAVSALAGANMINGMDDGTFAPRANATRAQVALLVYSMMGGVVK